MESKIGIIQDINVGLRWTSINILMASGLVKVTAKTGYLFQLMEKHELNFHQELLGKSILLDKDETGQLHWHIKLEVI